jgi:MFS family permease
LATVAATEDAVESTAARVVAAFGIAGYRYLWANTFLFALVQSTQRFTYVWLMLELGRSSRASGVVLFALGVPAFFVAMPAGALADRIDRKLLLVGSQLGALTATSVTAALILGGVVSVPATIALAVMLGTALAAGQPVRTALVPSLVPRDRLMNAIVLMTMGMNISMIAGPAIGGVAIAAWGVGGAFAVQAALYGVGLVVLMPLRIPERAVTPVRRRLTVEIREGLSFIAGHREIRALFILLASSGVLMMGPYLALVPEIAKNELGQGALTTSLLFAFLGIGMLTTSLFLASRRTMARKGGWFAGTLIAAGVIQAGFGISRWYLVTALLMLVWGLGGGLFINLNQTLIQSHTPEAVMGRVMSLHSLVMTGLAPVGALGAGVVAASLGAPTTIVVAGAGISLVAALVFTTQPTLRDLE